MKNKALKEIQKLTAVRIKEPPMPIKWDYAQSIEKVKGLTYKWGNLTEELACELWVAREILRAQGARTDLTSAQMRRSWQQYCQDIGSTKSTVNRWLARWFSAPELEWYQSSESCEWETPQWLFDMLNNEFGFETDVCARAENAKCEQFYTREDDGLAQEWTGVCWMNPPYGRNITEWMVKARESAEKGATVVCLVPARPDTDWWWDNALKGEIRFLHGRLKWPGSNTAAPFPSAVVVLGKNVQPGKVIWWDATRSDSLCPERIRNE